MVFTLSWKELRGFVLAFFITFIFLPIPSIQGLGTNRIIYKEGNRIIVLISGELLSGQGQLYGLMERLQSSRLMEFSALSTGIDLEYQGNNIDNIQDG
jgi:hypothetical protein